MGRKKSEKPSGIEVLWETMWGRFALVGFLLGFLWLVLLVDWAVFGADEAGLRAYGIRPRQVDGLPGILFAPFLHAGVNHLAMNAVPFLVLGCLMMIRGIRDFLFTVLVSILAGGGVVWLVGARGIHLGVSGVVFGLLGCLIVVGILERRPLGIVMSSLVTVFYGGLLLILVSGPVDSSWESHVFGFLSGLGSAWWLTRRVRRDRRQAWALRQARKEPATVEPVPEPEPTPTLEPELTPEPEIEPE